MAVPSTVDPSLNVIVPAGLAIWAVEPTPMMVAVKVIGAPTTPVAGAAVNVVVVARGLMVMDWGLEVDPT